jgi:dTMP kinase
LKLAIPSVLIHEPGGTILGEKIRRLLKHAADTRISPLAELLLFNASRIELVKDVIEPALNEDKIVLCDRFADSTVAYQSYGRGLDLATVREVNRVGTGGLKPSFTILLDIAPEKGLMRKGKNKSDRFELEDLSFHKRVRKGFLELAGDEPNRWLVIDSSRPMDEVRKTIHDKVIDLIRREAKCQARPAWPPPSGKPLFQP